MFIILCFVFNLVTTMQALMLHLQHHSWGCRGAALSCSAKAAGRITPLQPCSQLQVWTLLCPQELSNKLYLTKCSRQGLADALCRTVIITIRALHKCKLSHKRKRKSFDSSKNLQWKTNTWFTSAIAGEGESQELIYHTNWIERFWVGGF